MKNSLVFSFFPGWRPSMAHWSFESRTSRSFHVCCCFETHMLECLYIRHRGWFHIFFFFNAQVEERKKNILAWKVSQTGCCGPIMVWKPCFFKKPVGNRLRWKHSYYYGYYYYYYDDTTTGQTGPNSHMGSESLSVWKRKREQKLSSLLSQFVREESLSLANWPRAENEGSPLACHCLPI